MMMRSVDLYRTLAAEVGLETGWREVGSLRLASSQERMEELARQAGWAKTFGFPLELVSAEEAERLFPPLATDGVLGAAYLPTDGYVDPSQLTFALAEGARRRGAEIATRTRVTGIRVERNRVTAVETDQGEIETELVVNAGGMFAGEIGALAGVVVPIVPMAHEYLITRPAGVPLDVPTMRDPSLLVYFRGESGGLVVGGYARREYTLGRSVEVYATYYDVKYPGHERQAGRPLRVSPTNERLRELGAAWGEKAGWERANWFESNAASGDESLRPRGWAG